MWFSRFAGAYMTSTEAKKAEHKQLTKAECVKAIFDWVDSNKVESPHQHCHAVCLSLALATGRLDCRR